MISQGLQTGMLGYLAQGLSAVSMELVVLLD